MNDVPSAAWFYTREGEKRGPLSLEELQIKAKGGELNPRHDMVWTQGMETWKPAGEIDGLFERRPSPEPEPAPVIAVAPADPYSPPRQDPPAEELAKDGVWPGARRRSFLFMTIIFPALFTEGFSHGPPFLAPHLSPEMNHYVTIGCMFVAVILAICYSLMRLVNLGMSRWWYLGNFVPFLNLWLGYRCFACPAGYAVHQKLDPAGVFLAILYWLLIAIVILVILAIVAVLVGGLGTPELQQQIQDALRNSSQRPATP